MEHYLIRIAELIVALFGTYRKALFRIMVRIAEPFVASFGTYRRAFIIGFSFGIE